MSKIITPPAEVLETLKATASADYDKAMAAQRALAQALQVPLREGVLEGDTLAGVYSTEELQPGAQANYPLSFLAPGTEDDFVAFTMPAQARVPERHVEGDEVWVPTFRVANAIDWPLSYSRDARWDIVARALEVLRQGFTVRNNDDGWHVILAAAAARGLVVQDVAAAAGEFTKLLIARMKTVQKRTSNGEGYALTDLFVSPEAVEDLRDLPATDIGEALREQILQADEQAGIMLRLYGTNIHEVRKLGVDQAYNDYVIDTLGLALTGGDLEYVVGLDLTRRDSFVHPIRENLQVFEDPTMHRQGRQSFYSWGEWGWAALSNLRCVFGSF